ncbi:CopG family transcriptional regulator [Haloarculaceae archaeon H-GB2-1]|nr:CopG family transcriptional regulator [Haloarculaceae archaeon H-GB1-1]MEA5388563.1 CopG family transcriptional regulator [Haloarculaceae archaeon H-GB11]MEA5406617.1 CopG family transcriptional regulator [Haloarculaceae archaeon H-GB2-1]
MTRTEVNISDRLDSQIDRLVAQGDFLNREKAMEELLALGVSAYDTTGEDDEMDGVTFAEEMQNPGDRNGIDDVDDGFSL